MLRTFHNLMFGAALALYGCGSSPLEPADSARTTDDDDRRDVDVDDKTTVDDDDARGEPDETRDDEPAGAGPMSSGGQAFGDWTYHEVDGAVCRDGSPAGYYVRAGASSNLLIFLNGGGICYDDFFCGINPANVNSSLPGENLLAASLDIVSGALVPVRQVPPDAGIFKKDPRNPVADWSMVYVPYCTGDLHAGTKRDAEVFTATLQGKQQFVGYTNLGLFYEHFGRAYKGKAEKVLLSGSSAGGFGTLLNYDRTQDFFGSSTRVFALTDSGVPFRDEWLEPCLQKNVRALYGLHLPEECEGCFPADGGGLAEGLGGYIFKQKYKGRFLGGGISSKQDEIIKLFFSLGLANCTKEGGSEAIASFLGASEYPADRYPTGLKDFIENVGGKEQLGSYMVEGTQHQHIFRDRYFEQNGVGMTMAEFVGKVLASEPVHVGTL
ncbi:MAG: pectin acetylesterase-family hydrolase [Polyangiales bacterium]